MPWIYVDFTGMKYINDRVSTAISKMSGLKSDYQRIIGECDEELMRKTEISVAMVQISRALEKHIEALKQLQQGLDYAYDHYFALEAERFAYQIDSTKNAESLKVQSKEKYWEFFWNEYGWEGILSGAGYAGTIYDFIKDIREGKTWMDFVQSGVDIISFVPVQHKYIKTIKKLEIL